MTDDPDYAGATHLQLVFRLSGPDLDVHRFTTDTGVEPSDAYAKGERRIGGKANVAGWEWDSVWWTDQNTDPLMAEMLATLGPHVSLIRQEVDAGAHAWLTVVGEIFGDYIGTREELDRRGLCSDPDDETFEPFFVADRVGLALNRDVLEFLASAGVEFYTHIDAEVDPGPGRRRLSEG